MSAGCVALKADPAIMPFLLYELKVRLSPTRTGLDLEGARSAHFEGVSHDATSIPT